MTTTTKRQNQLIPITRTPSGEYQPSLISSGYQFRTLVKGPDCGYWTQHDHQGFDWRPDLEGLVRDCGGMPVIQLDDGGLFAIRNPCEFLRGCRSIVKQ